MTGSGIRPRAGTTGLVAAFDGGAARYDLLTGMNPGYHRHLQTAAAELTGRLRRQGRPWRLLDLACGSGSSTRALTRAAPAGTQVLGLDFSEGMLARTRGKRWPASVSFRQADAAHLDRQGLGVAVWDGVLAAYLFRNLDAADRTATAVQIRRLLRPGGWLVVQDYTVAGRRAATAVWDLVCWLVIIPLATLVGGNPGLYRYLWRSVRAFDSRGAFAARLVQAGFTDVRTRTVRGWQHGILHIVVARKPAR